MPTRFKRARAWAGRSYKRARSGYRRGKAKSKRGLEHVVLKTAGNAAGLVAGYIAGTYLFQQMPVLKGQAGIVLLAAGPALAKMRVPYAYSIATGLAIPGIHAVAQSIAVMVPGGDDTA